jgi:hypothetical protein
MESTYNPPLVLTILGAIFIGSATIVALWILLDIVLRKGWRSMMAVMLVTIVDFSHYPISITTDLVFHRIPVYVLNALYLAPLTIWTYIKYGRPTPPSSEQKPSCHQNGATESPNKISSDHQQHHGDQRDQHIGVDHEVGGVDHNMSSHANMHHGSSDRPMFATITVAVCHCGAGCLLGDIVGEWLVYGAGITINGRDLWAEYLIGTRSSLIFPCLISA